MLSIFALNILARERKWRAWISPTEAEECFTIEPEGILCVGLDRAIVLVKQALTA